MSVIAVWKWNLPWKCLYDLILKGNCQWHLPWKCLLYNFSLKGNCQWHLLWKCCYDFTVKCDWQWHLPWKCRLHDCQWHQLENAVMILLQNVIDSDVYFENACYLFYMEYISQWHIPWKGLFLFHDEKSYCHWHLYDNP